MNRSRKTIAIEAIFNERWDSRTGTLSDPIVRAEDIYRHYQTGNAYAFFKDIVRKSEIANKIWPSSVLQRGYTAIQDSSRDAIFIFTPLLPGEESAFDDKTKRTLYTKYNAPHVITEGETDWKHLKTALDKLKTLNCHTNMLIEFFEYDKNTPAGGAEMLNMCEKFARLKQEKLHIFVFDGDDKSILKSIVEEGKDYRNWGNNVFSFALPLPSHRSSMLGVCIEFYYTDQEIIRLDREGRRIFFSTEFRKSGRHKSENLTFSISNKIRNSDRVNIVDDSVFDDENDKNMALSKSVFAKYVLNQEDNFNDFDYTEFKIIFDIIDRIFQENTK